MNISKKRVINPFRYLRMIPPDGAFYVAAPLSDEDLSGLRKYGLQPDAPARIPIPRGLATRKNANGRLVAQKNLPKVPQYISHDYHIIDRHGNDHYGVCGYTRPCYQKTYDPPTELPFLIEGNTLYSKLFRNSEQSRTTIAAAMNIMLEMVGHFEIRTSEKAPALPPVRQLEVPWEILRAGSASKDEWERYMRAITERKTEAKKLEIAHRHEALWAENPEFFALGTQNFWGYVVYGFPKHNFYVFESNEVNNATYIFRGDWVAVSKLTKTEVLTHSLEDSRLFHTPQWHSNIAHKISGYLQEEVL